MSLIPSTPPQKPHAQDVADAVKLSNYNFVKTMVNQVEYNIKHCWLDDKHTPQEFLNEFGTDAGASMRLNAALIGLINNYEQTIGERLFDYSLLSVVKPYTENEDGTINVN